MGFAGHNRGKYFWPGQGYVRGRKARIFLASIGMDYKCPYCGHLNSSVNSIKLCGGCNRNFFEKKNGDVIFVGE